VIFCQAPIYVYLLTPIKSGVNIRLLIKREKAFVLLKRPKQLPMDYKKLHESLAKKHGISSDAVFTLRSFHKGFLKSREEIAGWCAQKMHQPRKRTGIINCGRREHGRPYYQEILNFVASASDEAWQDMMKDIT